MINSIVALLKRPETEASEVFCTQLRIPCSSTIGVTVDPVGPISFPVSARLAKSLIVEAEPARYGLKDQTLLDRKIRDTWEIPKSRIHTNADWDSQLGTALSQIQKNLNLPEDGVLTAELHNLLIYMPGQFFKAHQDSEKAEGMLATLVVLLPSEFTGGELIVDQHGDKKVFDFSMENQTSLILTAFYVDCYHEVKEVKSGYRVALTYNLFFTMSSKSVVTKPNRDLEKALQEYFADSMEETVAKEHPLWLVYLLDHEYTANSLDWSNLRGLDRDRVSELLDCAEKLGLTAHLALADIRETWEAESAHSWGGLYRSRKRWHEDDDDDSDFGEKSEDYTLSELLADEIALRYWVDRSGQHIEGRDKYISKQIVCWTKAVDQFKPFKSEYEGYMGNYGNTLDRWYHRAAIVLWKKEFDLINVFICNRSEAIRTINDLLRRDLSEGRKALQQILPYWKESVKNVVEPSEALGLALAVQDQALASALLRIFNFESLQLKNLPFFISLIDGYGEDWLLSLLNDWRERRDWHYQVSITAELEALVSAFAKKAQKISRWILENQLSLLFRKDAIDKNHFDRRFVLEKLPERLMAVETLLKTFLSVGESELHHRLLAHLLKQPSMYQETELVGLLLRLHNDIYTSSLKQLGERLQKRVLSPRKKGDWSIVDAIPDKCVDCEVLKEFLLSPTIQQLVWPLAKERRAHIHSIIDDMDIPVTHETLRKGSPHKLVLTKTNELFEKEKLEIEAIRKLLKNLRERKIIS